MDQLAAFVEARLSEDEKAARTGTLPEEVWGARGWYEPERVIAECRSKRRLMRYASSQLDEPQGTEVLRLLALPWAGHGDHLPEWKV